jgi:hypothetical protein
MTTAPHDRRPLIARLTAIASRTLAELRHELERLNSIGLAGDSLGSRRERARRVRRALAARHSTRAPCC